MKYKNLFFDLDDTIWAFSRNARDTFEEVYQKYSFDRYFDSFDHYYTLYHDAIPNSGLNMERKGDEGGTEPPAFLLSLTGSRSGG